MQSSADRDHSFMYEPAWTPSIPVGMTVREYQRRRPRRAWRWRLWARRAD